MNDKGLEMLNDFELKDNDEEDDKLEEHEINAQLNIIPENNNQIQNNEEENQEKINENNELNFNNENIINNNNDNNNIFNEQINILSNSETKSIFENPYLQTSYNLFTKLRRIIIRKENLTKINYFDKWQKIIKSKQKNIITSDLNNKNEQNENKVLIQNRNIIQNILNNEDIEQIPNNENIDNINNNNKSHNEIILEHQNQLLKSGEQNFKALINPFASINEMNFETDNSYINNNIFNNNMNINNINNINNNEDINEKLLNNNLPKEKKLLCLSLLLILENKLYHNFKRIIQSLKFRIIISNYTDKLFQMDRLNKKYESILDEKSSIIINKTDEIEDLKEKLENMSKNLKDAIKKQKALNIIPESLCSKCGRSLEESFCGDGMSENQKIIKEQNELIEKMKKENNELRNKYNYSELRLKDLDEIKKEFENLSGVLLKPKIDDSTQTEGNDNSQNLSTSFLTNTTNESNSYNNNKSKNNMKKTGNNKNNTLNKNKFGNGKKNQNQQKKVTNYNIININNNNNNTSFLSNTNNFLNSTNSNNSSITNEGILSSELLNLNKEFNKLKNEYKIVNERNNKFEKEKKEINDKLKLKNEQYEKLKNENAELMILINNSRYKNIIEIENENKKLKMTLEQIDNEIKNMNIINEKNESKIKEQNIQMEKMKSIINTYNSFKEQKDNLLLMNTKYESELKKLRYELEQSANMLEKTKIMLNNSEKNNEKLNTEISYYSLHINKYKEDAAKALQDAVEYQQIVQALQSQINEYKVALNKLKQNKKLK